MGEDVKGGTKADVRPAIIGASLLLLAGIVILVLLGRDSAPGVAVTPPARCLLLWNGDPGALRYGAHNSVSHGYARAEVVRINRDGEVAPAGACAVVFPAVSLDPEPVAAAQVFLHGGWAPLSSLGSVSEARLAKLQAEAVRDANVVLREDGSLDSSW